LFLPHLVLRTGLKAAYGIAALDSAYDSFVAARGMFDPEPHAASGRALGSLDLLAPIALLDQPILFGLALLGMSAGLHVEVAADWDFDPASFQMVPWVYTGAEIIFQLGSSNLNLPLGIGFAARFDATGARSFDIGTDLRPYLFLSFNSLRDAWKVDADGAPTMLR